MHPPGPLSGGLEQRPLAVRRRKQASRRPRPGARAAATPPGPGPASAFGAVTVGRMSFGLGRGRTLDPGTVGVREEELPSLPDDVASRPDAARIDPRCWFERSELPFEIEIGSGKGTFLLEEASRHPDTNFLGIEIAREFYAYAADRCRRRGLGNVRMLCADAGEFLHWRVRDGVVDSIHLYFPDPWPKSRHHKRRIVQDRFLEDARRVLKSGGELRIVTDHDDYWAWMESFFERWAPAHGGGPFIRRMWSGRSPESGEGGEIVGTNFERKYAREGRSFHAIVLERIESTGSASP